MKYNIEISDGRWIYITNYHGGSIWLSDLPTELAIPLIKHLRLLVNV